MFCSDISPSLALALHVYPNIHFVTSETFPTVFILLSLSVAEREEPSPNRKGATLSDANVVMDIL